MDWTTVGVAAIAPISLIGQSMVSGYQTIRKAKWDRRYALDDHWRDERADAHKRMLTALRGAQKDVMEFHRYDRYRQDFEDIGVPFRRTPFTDETSSLLIDALPDVEMYGSRRASGCATTAYVKFLNVQTALTEVGDDDGPSEESFGTLLEEALAARREYLQLVRRDIGTSAADA